MTKKAIDLYSGIGGWTLGMKLSGIENVASFEWWTEANNTHNLNFHTNHQEIDIRKINIEKDLVFPYKIDYVVGSPPCTQFSFANKGGNGDIDDGLVDIVKFLDVVSFLKPKYWAMENVPRVAGILEQELKDGGRLAAYKNLVKSITVVDTSDYGVPQSRKRMIAGDFPLDLFKSYAQNIEKKTLGNVIESLGNETITDPNYRYELNRAEISDNLDEPNLTDEEARINRDAKSFNPVYNSMSFPDRLDRPARTITATCTRVSRESIIVNSHNGYRRLNVRERGVVQGFPITYQFYGKTLNSKFKMIGNAVPPVLTYYIFQSMLKVKKDALKHPSESAYQHTKPEQEVPVSKFDSIKLTYPEKRKFQYAIPNLRFGSGVRFELSNSNQLENIPWSFKFFFGNSKNILSIDLDDKLFKKLYPLATGNAKLVLDSQIEFLKNRFRSISSAELQKLWTKKSDSVKAFDFIDEVGTAAEKIAASIDQPIGDELISEILKVKNTKLIEHKKYIFVGLVLLSKLNKIFFHK